MSRTKKGKKGCGYEYWSRRPGNRNCGSIGAATKKDTVHRERMAQKRTLRNALREEAGR